VQEDASVVQAFVHAAYEGSWSVDTAIETSSWWGLELGAVEHPPVEDGDVWPIALPMFQREERFFVTLPDGMTVKVGGGLPTDVAHAWVEKQVILTNEEKGSIDDDTGESYYDKQRRERADRLWSGARDWIETLRDDRFMLIFDGQNHVPFIDQEEQDLDCFMVQCGLPQWLCSSLKQRETTTVAQLRAMSRRDLDDAARQHDTSISTLDKWLMAIRQGWHHESKFYLAKPAYATQYLSSLTYRQLSARAFRGGLTIKCVVF
jgi:hypothetical protein